MTPGMERRSNMVNGILVFIVVFSKYVLLLIVLLSTRVVQFLLHLNLNYSINLLQWCRDLQFIRQIISKFAAILRILSFYSYTLAIVFIRSNVIFQIKTSNLVDYNPVQSLETVLTVLSFLKVLPLQKLHYFAI